jgi:hypothetical protein
MRRKFELVLAVAVVAVASGAPAGPSTFASPTSPTAAPSTSAPSPIAADAVGAIQTVCLPALRGASFASQARSAGFSMENGASTLRLARGAEASLEPPDVANPHVCSATVSSGANDAAGLKAAIGSWAAAQTPPIVLVNTQSSAAEEPTTSAWGAATSNGTLGVGLDQSSPPTNGPAGGQEQSTLYVGLTPA